MGNNNKQNDEFRGLNKLLKSQAVKFLFEKFGDGTYTEFIDDWKWIFSYSKKYKWIIVFYTLLGLSGSTLSLVAAVIGQKLIDIITGYQYSKLWLLILAMVASTLFSMISDSILGRFNLKISIYVNNDIQAEIFNKIIDSDWQKLTEYQNGDLLNRFNSDVGTIAGNAVSWVPNVIIAIYTFVATFVVLLSYDPVMAIFAFATSPVLLLVSRRVMRKSREYQKRVMEMNSGMMSFETETFYNFDSIKSFGVTNHYENELRGWQQKYKDYNLEYNLYTIKLNLGLSSLSTSVSMIAFLYCLFRMWERVITYGEMSVILSQSGKLASSFSSIIGIFPSMISSAVSAHRIREIVDLPKEVHDPESAEKLRPLAKDGFTVRMKTVDFSYVEDNQIITGLDFVAQPNEIVALIGPSGQGKTTMLRLILGLIHPQEGEALIEASDGSAYPMNADLREFFSYVPQGNTMLAGTVAENLRVVKNDATDEEIVEALKIACAWDYVETLPDGINGKLGERGRGLSEGQVQRIAIARAVLRDAPILLLDEATSALDEETEAQVLSNIIKQRPNKTCIVSTHRPSVLSMCQRIYRINEAVLEEVPYENL
ncbi:ABC transporter ATP-binding protein [Eubacterium oxidoreducens]|uniref:ABC-type multidrug transport system, ATPase and permease component n=1 Tax=Eubacterium oxidoreducens TaxID=1732 RepID=A0A1G6AV98_EUBOX|nr:ABC transporter ATP-binding protein [Eubacterium oxidoreducens]SDB12262.1 ABC-type multidrug transport system, ATPase and permease component [Eubacterium oxidoreducens]